MQGNYFLASEDDTWQGQGRHCATRQGSGYLVQPVTMTQGKGKTTAALSVTTTQGKGKAAASPDRAAVTPLPAEVTVLPVILSLQLVMSPTVQVPMLVPAPVRVSLQSRLVMPPTVTVLVLGSRQLWPT
jgi:hypothetical protein